MPQAPPGHDEEGEGENDTDDEDEDDSQDGGDSEEEDDINDHWNPPQKNIGSVYIKAIAYGSTYAALCHGGSISDQWFELFRGIPPATSPVARKGQPLSEVDRVWISGMPLREM